MADEKVLAVKLAFKAGGYKQEIKAINLNLIKQKQGQRILKIPLKGKKQN